MVIFLSCSIFFPEGSVSKAVLSDFTENTWKGWVLTVCRGNRRTPRI